MPGTHYLSPTGSDANPGTLEQPWRSLQFAVDQLRPGERLFLRGGLYELTEMVTIRCQGNDLAPIVIAAAPGELPVIDASRVPLGNHVDPRPYPEEQGALLLQDAAHLRIHGLRVQNSHNAGIMVRDSQHIDLTNNTVDTTYACGIALWDTYEHKGTCRYIRVLGNTIIKANTYDMHFPGYPRGHETPHEALSVAGAHHFEVAWNHVHHCEKEGIDVKETSCYGVVHHNYVHHCWRQALYADSWFGVLEDVEFHNNVAHDCQGAGFALSTEGGELCRNVRVHHNLLYNNWGTGVYFSRWGGDGPREQISIHHNTVVNNGWGTPRNGENFFWMIGGLYFFSANVQGVEIRDNIFSQNCGFQIGYNRDEMLKEYDTPAAAFAARQIAIENNALYQPQAVAYPIRFGWHGNYGWADPYPGSRPVNGDPLFVDAAAGDLRLKDGSAAQGLGAYSEGADLNFWWRENFPPEFPLY